MMPPKGARTAVEQLDALLDADLISILEADDAAIREEASAVHGDPIVAAARVRARVAATATTAGKRRLAEAKEAIVAAPSGGATVLMWSAASKRALLARLRASHQGLTLAARDGREESDADLDSLLEDLIDLDVIDEQGNPR